MTTTLTKWAMLANLQPGQFIDHIIFPNGDPIQVQSKIIRIEIQCNFGRLWTTNGVLPWQMLTYKYKVVMPPS